MKKYSRSLIAAAAAMVCFGFQDAEWNPLPTHKNLTSSAPAYLEAIQRTADMVSDHQARAFASHRGFDILNLTWEDPGRFKGSAVGPNISDMTIQVGAENPATKQFQVTCMPVIRQPNFADVTCDIDPHDFTLLVGNEKGRSLRRVSLYEFLETPTKFLSNPGSWLGRNKTLLADRDSKVLVSAQACFLPIPKTGKATFNPVLFNYQSVSGDPAVLTILATREGTSTTIIDNKRDAFQTGIAWGQRLFHNANGQRASLTGERESDFNAHGGDGGSTRAGAGMNMVLLIQVPLKQKHPMRTGGAVFADSAKATFGGGGGAAATRRGGSDVENAVIGHGDLEGPFTEVDNQTIERDPNYPVRVTVQFYKGTSNGIVSEGDMNAIKHDIDRVYSLSDFVGSLVTDGETGRVTEYYGNKIQPADWWQQFWKRHEANTGDTPAEARAKLRKLLGEDFEQRPVSDLYLHDLLRK